VGKQIALVLIGTLTAVSCGGGSSGQSPVQGVSPGGIWRGSDSASGLSVTGLIDESGSADLIRADNAQFVGQMSATDSGVTGSGEAFAQADGTFPDGSTHGQWSISGSIQERQAITAQLTFTTDNGTETKGALDLTFDPLYEQPSSLATVAGSYVPVGGGFQLYVGTDGTLQLSELICEISGQLSVINPAYNLYHVHMITTCDNGLNTDASGVATLDDTLTPEQLLMGLVSPDYSSVLAWQRQ
jgi:hypothetical protein